MTVESELLKAESFDSFKLASSFVNSFVSKKMEMSNRFAIFFFFVIILDYPLDDIFLLLGAVISIEAP